MELRGEDLVNKLRATSNRGQEGRGWKLGCSSNANPSSSCRERSLKPCAVINEVHISDVTQKQFEKTITGFNVRRKETWDGPEDVQYLEWKGWWRRRRVLCDWRRQSLSPMRNVLLDDISNVLPMEEPRMSASSLLSTRRPGAAYGIASLVIKFSHISSNLVQLRCRPKSEPSFSTICMS